MTHRDAQALEVAHWQVLAFHARSFRWASALLSREQRSKVAALYAFCRTVDDLADAEGRSLESELELEQLYRALAEGPDSATAWPTSHLWFLDLCIECGIELSVVRELLAGMLSDLGTVRLQDDEDLIRYCYRAAGTVGLMMCSVLQVRDPRAMRHAMDLGIAMQLTNICRDVLEDAEARRVYLPAERLAEYGATPEQLVDGVADEHAVRLVVQDLLELADDYYRSGDAGMRYLPARARWAVLVASRLYRAIGRRLRRRQNSNPLLGRVVVPWMSKLGLVVAASASWIRLSLFPPKNVTTPSPVALLDAGTDSGTVVHPLNHAVGQPH